MFTIIPPFFFLYIYKVLGIKYEIRIEASFSLSCWILNYERFHTHWRSFVRLKFTLRVTLLSRAFILKIDIDHFYRCTLVCFYSFCYYSFCEYRTDRYTRDVTTKYKTRLVYRNRVSTLFSEMCKYFYISKGMEIDAAWIMDTRVVTPNDICTYEFYIFLNESWDICIDKSNTRQRCFKTSLSLIFEYFSNVFAAIKLCLIILVLIILN